MRGRQGRIIERSPSDFRFRSFPVTANLHSPERQLIELRIEHGDLDNLIEKGDFRRYYMHRTGHWLGLDVHDAGEYKIGNDWTTLQPGMTLTVEPGLYIRPGTDIPAELAGIGIRIEDDVRVTETGCEVYTSAPKTVREIEETMRHD